MDASRARRLESAILGACESPTPGLYARVKEALPDITPKEYGSMRKKLYNEGLIEQTYDYCLSPVGETIRNRERRAE